MKTQKPAIPSAFREKNANRAIFFVVYSCLLYFLSGYLSFLTYSAEIHPAAKCALVAFFVFMAANGLHLLGWVAHEGAHLLLVENKILNVALGSFFGATLFLPVVGFALNHWAHHKNTNTKDDPDTVIQVKYQGFWGRFLFARLNANRQYTKIMLAVIFGGAKEYPSSISQRALFWLSLLSLLFIASWITFYISILINYTEYAIFAFLLPMLALLPITGLRIYIEHTDAKVDDFLSARTYKHKLYTIFLFANNYHLEHHLYPGVPCYNLPAVHRYLTDNGYYRNNDKMIVDGFWDALKYTAGKFKYPEGVDVDAT